MTDMQSLLRANPYPGRGIALGITPEGKRLVVVYFIMGRSENSRNRVFIMEGENLRIQPHDPAGVSDPSLIIYRPIRRVDNRLIVTNGDQTDTIYRALRAGGSFESALRTRSFEPDAPNWTPRISALADCDSGSFRMSILKAQDAEGERCLRFFFEYPPLPGRGYFLHTYRGDGPALSSFAGEPLGIPIPEDIPSFAQALWDSLDADNRVALYVTAMPLGSGAGQSHVFNRHPVKEEA